MRRSFGSDTDKMKLSSARAVMLPLSTTKHQYGITMSKAKSSPAGFPFEVFHSVIFFAVPSSPVLNQFPISLRITTPLPRQEASLPP